MDKRKLHVTPEGYIGIEHDGYLQLVTPFREDAFRDQHRNVEEEPRENAAEIARRWNAHPKLVEALRQAIVCIETGADDSEEAGYPSRAESMREDANTYRAILNELNPEN